jgi:hypothetical protein
VIKGPDQRRESGRGQRSASSSATGSRTPRNLAATAATSTMATPFEPSRSSVDLVTRNGGHQSEVQSGSTESCGVHAPLSDAKFALD